MKFAQLGLQEPLIRAVTKAGYAAPTPIQALAIPEALAGKDVLGASETGTGKTIAFALPVLQRLAQWSPPKNPLSRRVRALIVTANSDLAVRIDEHFSKLGRQMGLVHTTLLTGQARNPLLSPLRCVDVLITTPERLIDLHTHGGIDMRAVEILVIDEADRMADMGSLPDVQRIVSQLPFDRQTLMFTATRPASVNSLADSILRDPARIRIPPTQKAAVVVQQSVCFIDRPHKTSLLIAWLGQRTTTRTVVFTRNRQGADRVVRQLISCGYRAEAIHGEKPFATRMQTLQRFKSNQPPILVVTDLAARGIEVDTISHVVNFDLPMEPETYIHRIGRMTRAGHKGVSVTFCDESERPLLKGIERLLRREIPIDDATRPFDKLPRVGKTEVIDTPPTPKRPRRNDREAVAIDREAQARATRKSGAAAAKAAATPTAKARPVAASRPRTEKGSTKSPPVKNGSAKNTSAKGTARPRVTTANAKASADQGQGKSRGTAKKGTATTRAAVAGRRR